MPNFFSDPELRARQTQLNAQWSSLWATYQSTCENGLGNAFPEFASDYRAWQDFYESESDWSSASKHETDIHQTKAQEWSKRLANYGCGDKSLSDLGIPGVKDPPADPKGFTDKLADIASKPFEFVKNLTIGIGILIAVIVLALIWFISNRDFSVTREGGSVS